MITVITTKTSPFTKTTPLIIIISNNNVLCHKLARLLLSNGVPHYCYPVTNSNKKKRGHEGAINGVLCILTNGLF